MKQAQTLGRLRKSGWLSRTVKEEIRQNAIKRIQQGEELFPGVLGYENTVIPQLENALLAGHDFIFLGERGQAKTRMIRGLTDLLDEWMPIIAGSEINDDPYNPVSKYAIDLVNEKKDATPIEWVHRSERFGEKLATPDTAIADLIGEVDPIKVAEGRYLSDELTLHYGLVPRTNRGIFAINELPDLSERIQVGLLNVLEERDVQVRGYKIRLPLDILLVASANPEDYTNRGRIITPLKDRFGSQLRTHYPFEVELEKDIAVQEAEIFSQTDLAVSVPEFMSMIVATVTHAARESSHINQRSGVSVRVTVANYEALIAGAVRRTLLSNETEVIPRISDLSALIASTAGKIEVESLDDGREIEIIQYLIKQSILDTFKATADLSDELTLHYGLVPRTNRGIFAINELPDLSERIQVGLLNVLEERDVQVRGYKIRLPLDILLVASANPEDYTNRGRIITPLKDRFGSQLRTHYPFEVELEKDIAVQEAEIFSQTDLAVSVPEFMSMIVATVTHAARESSHINQRSGVSVRVTVANYEALIAGAVRRTLLSNETEVIPRISDLSALIASTAGKIEVESLDDGREIEIIQYLIKQSILDTFKATADQTLCADILKAFTDGAVINAGDDIPSDTYLQWLKDIPAFTPVLESIGLTQDDLQNPSAVASGIEFILEGLHLSKLLNKEAMGDSGVYRARA